MNAGYDKWMKGQMLEIPMFCLLQKSQKFYRLFAFGTLRLLKKIFNVLRHFFSLLK